MSSAILKSISETAKLTGATEIEIISAMQSQCAKIGDTKTLDALCKIKRKFIDKIILLKSGN